MSDPGPDHPEPADTTLSRPRFKHCYHVEVLDPDQVFLLAERQQLILEGRGYHALAPLLTGDHTREEILKLLTDKLPVLEILFALDQLERKGYLVEADAGRPAAWLAFWDALDIRGEMAAAALARTRVRLCQVGPVSAEPLRSRLAELGIATTDEQGEDDQSLRVVLTDDHGREALDEVNRQALASRRPWLLLKPVGAVLWLGPLFVPGATGCWACLASRLRGNRRLEAYLLERTGRRDALPTSLPALPTTLDLAASGAATEIAKWAVFGRSERLEGRIVTQDVLSLEVQEHALVRRPQCPACGDPELLRKRGTPPIAIRSRPKVFSAEGGHRIEMPEETYRRLQHHVSPLTGIVSSLVRADPQENGVTFSYAAGHSFPMLSADLRALRADLRFRSGGKGASDIQARVSAISEAIERYSGIWRGDEPTRRASLEDLGEAALHLNDVMLFSDTQYSNRRAWNQRCSPTHYHVVPEPFDPKRVVDWCALWSLTHERVRYLPAAYCYYGHPEIRTFFCGADGNGTSSGNALEEAILQGFFELVERDAVALWWYNRALRPALDLDSFRLRYVDELREHYRRIHRDCWVLDLTTDLGIPTFAAVSPRTDRLVEDIVVGFGAHFDPQIALLRSLTEVNQCLPELSRTAPDGTTAYPDGDPDAVNWWRTATLESEPYLRPQPGAGARRASAFTRRDHDDLARDVETCVEIAAEHGMEVLVLDQTLPDVGQSVVRVVVPGLRHFWRRLGQGRLYDVPVRLGWLAERVPEDRLNPFSIFF